MTTRELTSTAGGGLNYLVYHYSEKLFRQKMIDNIFDRNKTTAQCHVRVNDMEFGRYFCRAGFMRGYTKTGACFERDFAQNQPGLSVCFGRVMVSNKYIYVTRHAKRYELGGRRHFEKIRLKVNVASRKNSTPKRVSKRSLTYYKTGSKAFFMLRFSATRLSYILYDI